MMNSYGPQIMTPLSSPSRLGGLVLFLGWMLIAPGLSRPAQAQEASSEKQFQDGRRAFEMARYDEAIAHLEPLFEAQPAFRHDTEGTAAYWLGQAYAAQNEDERALAVWHAGLDALEADDLFDVALADAYIRHVFRQRRQNLYVRATTVYLDLLDQAGEPLPRPTHKTVFKHVAQTIFLLPASMPGVIFDETTYYQAGVVGLKPGAGARLRTWWRSQDPLPATQWNERIAEHLERVAVAEERYSHRYTASGFDQRGDLYVRLGEPDRVEHLKNDIMIKGWADDYPELKEFLLDNRDASFFVAQALVPPNEFWTYSYLGRYANYLFIQKSKGFQLATTRDLIPSELRQGFSPSSPRGYARTIVSMLVSAEYYDQLSTLDPEFTSRYFQVDRYIRGMVEGIPNPENPASFMYRFLAAGEREDRRLDQIRTDSVPTILTNAFIAPPLAVETRQARFLDDDGTTRTEIYWAVPPNGLMPALGIQAQILAHGHKLGNRYAVNLTAVQKHVDYRPRQITRQRYTMRETYTPGVAAIPVHSATVRGDTAMYHLALQWDTYMRVGAEEQPAFSYVKTGTQQADSLQALNAAAGTLELSDPVPLYAADLDPNAPIRKDGAFLIKPYLPRTITSQTPLALYFEVYHLAFGPDDQTHFTVEYEIARREGGGLARYLGLRQDEITAVSTTYTGSSRTAKEHIMLDLSEWSGSGPLTITVRVSDETTGQRVERTLDFELEEGR